jgi:hypothetical protein
MTDENNTILNLDEMLGAQSLTVRYQGKEYPLRTVKSLSPQEFGRVMAYGTTFSNLKDDAIESNPEAVVKAIDDVLEILAPSLPRYQPTLKERFSRGYKRRFIVSLHEATAILQFWNQQNSNSKNDQGAVMPKPKRKRR